MVLVNFLLGNQSLSYLQPLVNESRFVVGLLYPVPSNQAHHRPAALLSTPEWDHIRKETLDPFSAQNKHF